MNDEEINRLVQMIASKLTSRKDQHLTVNHQEQFELVAAPSKSLFLNYDHVSVKNIHVNLIKDLYEFRTTNPWVEWLLTGLSYQVSIELDINQAVMPFIPWKMLTRWPVTFKHGGNKIYGCESLHLKREDIWDIPDQSILIKTNQQKLTSEAQELAVKKELQLIERVDQSCIWGE